MDSTKSIRNDANEPKVHEKSVRTAIKQDLNPDQSLFDYAIMGHFRKQNKTNATSHPNIGALKNAIEEEWNKMSEEFILKVCKSFRRCVDIIIEKKWSPHKVSLLFCVYFLVLIFCCFFFFFVFFYCNHSCFMIELFIIIQEYSEFCFLTL